MSNFTQLTSTERALLKTASAQSQANNKLAKEFREMLINRECISSLTTVQEFMTKENLIEAIKLCWLLGYSDKIESNNLSKGLLSDYDLMQLPPKSNESVPTDDVDAIKDLTVIRNVERRKMNRNIETFIRNMGWVEEEVERKTKKRVTSKKDEVIKKVDNLLDTSSTASSSVTGSTPSNPSMSKAKTDRVSNNSTRVPAYKETTMNVLKLPDIINIDDERSEVTDSEDFECKKYLKKLLTGNRDTSGIIAYVDNDGDVQIHVIDTNVLTGVMESMNMNIMNEDGDNNSKA